MSWPDKIAVRAQWPDAAGIPDDVLDRYIASATSQCVRFAPTLPEGAEVPPAYVTAVILQTRELWAAGQREGDLIGVGEYAVRARPLTPTVRSLLRPERGRPVIG